MLNKPLVTSKTRALAVIQQQVLYLNHKQVESVQSVHRRIAQRLEHLVNKYNNRWVLFQVSITVNNNLIKVS